MWASEAALPSASVSTRMIVPPGTFALARAVTLLSASPVSGVSSLRCRPHACPPLGAAAGPLAANSGAFADNEPFELDPLASCAIPYVPAVMPNARAASTTIRSGVQRLTLPFIASPPFGRLRRPTSQRKLNGACDRAEEFVRAARVQRDEHRHAAHQPRGDRGRAVRGRRAQDGRELPQARGRRLL